MWCDIINCGCDSLYSIPDIKHIECAMSCIQTVWYHGKGGFETQVQWLWWKKYSEYVVVTMDKMSTYIEDEFS